MTVPNGSCNVVYEEKCNVEYQTEIVDRCQDQSEISTGSITANQVPGPAAAGLQERGEGGVQGSHGEQVRDKVSRLTLL